MKFWIRPESSGVLFSDNRPFHSQPLEEDFITISIDIAKSSLKLVVAEGEIQRQEEPNTHTNEDLAVATWVFTGVAVSYDNDSADSTATLYIGHSTAQLATFDRPIIDDVNNQKFIGVEENTSLPEAVNLENYYTGFMYHFCITSLDSINTSDEIDPEPCFTGYC